MAKINCLNPIAACGMDLFNDTYEVVDDFAADLYRMYCKFAEKNRWKIDTMNSNENGIGGFKEIVFMINGLGAYSKLKYESGVHRVQRIPATESGGRIHTSTATVAIKIGRAHV